MYILMYFIGRKLVYIYEIKYTWCPLTENLFWTQRQLICTLLDIDHIDIFYENLLSKVADKIGQAYLDKVVDLGLLTEEPVLKLGSPLDTFSQFIASKLSLGNNWSTYMQCTCSDVRIIKITTRVL